MRVIRVISLALIVIAALLGLTPSTSTAADLCGGIDKDFLTKHVPFPFEKVVDTITLNDLNMCQVIIRVNGNNAPLYVPATKDAVIAGDIFRNRTPVSRSIISQIDSQGFQQYVNEVKNAVAFTYKPPKDIKGLVYMVTDPECPYCERAKEQIKQFADDNGVEIRVILLPLPMHPGSRDKAVKGICAKMDYNDYLAARYQGELCREGEDMVAKSIDITRKLGVNGTPTFINATGKRVSGFIPDQLNGLL